MAPHHRFGHINEKSYKNATIITKAPIATIPRVKVVERSLPSSIKGAICPVSELENHRITHIVAKIQ